MCLPGEGMVLGLACGHVSAADSTGRKQAVELTLCVLPRPVVRFSRSDAHLITSCKHSAVLLRCMLRCPLPSYLHMYQTTCT
jgi:hypothetical protein